MGWYVRICMCVTVCLLLQGSVILLCLYMYVRLYIHEYVCLTVGRCGVNEHFKYKHQLLYTLIDNDGYHNKNLP